jgi:simple sugar transport system permease protein
MIAGHLDLSVGTVIPAASMTVAIVSGFYEGADRGRHHCGARLGLLVGFVNGYLVVKTDLPSFVVTLATLFAVRAG